LGRAARNEEAVRMRKKGGDGRRAMVGVGKGEKEEKRRE
jgi:hypothetical protein